MVSKRLLLFLVSNFMSDSYGQKAEKFFRNDYTYMDEFESFYKFHTIPQIWSDAKRICALEGGILWHPDNDDEANGLLTFWNKTKPRIEYIYVGLSDILVEGIFETVDGKSVSEVYNNWEPDQPNDFEGQDCVYMYLNDGPGYLDDYSCNERYSFICKKTLESLEWNHKCNTPYKDYTYNKDNGKCYKLHTTPLDWTEAYARCQVEQSYLAVVNNRAETDFLVFLAESSPKPRTKVKFSRGIYHLGFHNRFNEGWRTVKGTPLKADRKSWYDNYQPEDDSYEQCGSMFFNGRLINTNCDSKSYFICEREVDNVSATIANTLSGSERPILEPYFGGGFL